MEINIRNKRTWKQEGYYVGRPSVLGNPFPINKKCSRHESIENYKLWFISAIINKYQPVIRELNKMEEALIKDRKIDLVCWCAPKLCHASIIRDALLNKIHTGEFFNKSKFLKR